MNKKYDDMNVVIRPHPLTFSNMIKEGRMTEAEVVYYKKRLEDEGVRIDSNKMIEDTLFETDILISDYSAILIMYFLTGSDETGISEFVMFPKNYMEVSKWSLSNKR